MFVGCRLKFLCIMFISIFLEIFFVLNVLIEIDIGCVILIVYVSCILYLLVRLVVIMFFVI